MTPISPMMSNSTWKSISASSCPHAGRRQRRENGDRVNVALVEHAERNIDGGDGGEDQDRFLGQRLLEKLRRAGDRRRHVDAGDGGVDLVGRLTE